MSIENLRNILDGYVNAGMGDNEVKIRVTNNNHDVVTIESSTVYRDHEGNLTPFFNGFGRDA